MKFALYSFILIAIVIIFSVIKSGRAQTKDLEYFSKLSPKEQEDATLKLQKELSDFFESRKDFNSSKDVLSGKYDYRQLKAFKRKLKIE